MGKRFNYGRKSLMLLALFFGITVVAAPQAVASWDEDKKSGHGDHHGDKKMSGGWKGKSAGGNFDMGGDGFMTARLRAVWTLNLSSDQKSKIRALQRDLRSKTWALEDKIEEASDKMFDLYKAKMRDAKAIGKVYTEIFDYRRQKIEAAIETGNKVEAVLTKKQWMSLKKWSPDHKWGGGWGDH